jgi:hypothetical protein
MRAQRFPLELPVRYRCVGESEWMTSMTQNISRSGVLFHAVRPLDVATQIEINIAMPQVAPASGAAEVRCRAQIVRIATASDQPQTVVAAAFLDFKFNPPGALAASH